jgi:23S rRNA (guanosine2251-2'-O)-methyltransferase
MAHAGIGDRVEGFHAVVAALDAGRVRRLWVETSRLRHEVYDVAVTSARSAGVEVVTVHDVRPAAVTEAPQGTVADCRPIPPVDLDEAIDLATPTALLVLDRLQDPRNLGAIARSALAAGVPAMVIPQRRSAPIGATAFKAAAGALEKVAVVEVGSPADALQRLRRRDVWLVGLDGTAERSLFGLDLLAEPVAIVVGAEGSGVSRLVGDRLDVAARIPMVGATESLNASVAASLAVFELARVRGWIS